MLEDKFDKFSFLLAVESFETAIRQAMKDIEGMPDDFRDEYRKGFKFGYLKCLEYQLLAIEDMKKMWHE